MYDCQPKNCLNDMTELSIYLEIWMNEVWSMRQFQTMMERYFRNIYTIWLFYFPGYNAIKLKSGNIEMVLWVTVQVIYQTGYKGQWIPSKYWKINIKNIFKPNVPNGKPFIPTNTLHRGIPLDHPLAHTREVLLLLLITLGSNCTQASCLLSLHRRVTSFGV